MSADERILNLVFKNASKTPEYKAWVVQCESEDGYKNDLWKAWTRAYYEAFYQVGKKFADLKLVGTVKVIIDEYYHQTAMHGSAARQDAETYSSDTFLELIEEYDVKFNELKRRIQ